MQNEINLIQQVDIGNNVVWDSVLSTVSFLISVILASYKDFFGIPEIVLKTVFVVLGM